MYTLTVGNDAANVILGLVSLELKDNRHGVRGWLSGKTHSGNGSTNGLPATFLEHAVVLSQCVSCQ